jgi:hypothetical protein
LVPSLEDSDALAILIRTDRTPARITSVPADDYRTERLLSTLDNGQIPAIFRTLWRESDAIGDAIRRLVLPNQRAIAEGSPALQRGNVACSSRRWLRQRGPAGSRDAFPARAGRIRKPAR